MSDLSISISTGTAPTQPSPWAQRKALFDQLGQALQSGDLAGAQKAYSALQADAPQGAGQGQGPFAALGAALQKGDLAGAQQAFSQLQQARGRRRHRQDHDADDVQGATTSTEKGQFAQMKALFDQLGQALQNGDLQGAQKAFAALQASLPPKPVQGSGASQTSGTAQAAGIPSPFQALADALQKGDLSAARQAFAQIQQARGGHPHHRAAQAGSGAADADGDRDGSQNGGSTTSITINLTA